MRAARTRCSWARWERQPLLDLGRSRKPGSGVTVLTLQRSAHLLLRGDLGAFECGFSPLAYGLSSAGAGFESLALTQGALCHATIGVSNAPPTRRASDLRSCRRVCPAWAKPSS